MGRHGVQREPAVRERCWPEQGDQDQYCGLEDALHQHECEIFFNENVQCGIRLEQSDLTRPQPCSRAPSQPQRTAFVRGSSMRALHTLSERAVFDNFRLGIRFSGTGLTWVNHWRKHEPHVGV